MSARRGIQCTVSGDSLAGWAAVDLEVIGGCWTEAGSSPPQTVSPLINANDIMCVGGRRWEICMRKPLAGPAPLSMCEDHLHLTGVLSLQLEFKISMRSMHLFEVDGKKLTIVINTEHIWWPGAVCLAVHGTARHNLDRSDLWLRDLSVYIYVCHCVQWGSRKCFLGAAAGRNQASQ